MQVAELTAAERMAVAMEQSAEYERIRCEHMARIAQSQALAQLLPHLDAADRADLIKKKKKKDFKKKMKLHKKNLILNYLAWTKKILNNFFVFI